MSRSTNVRRRERVARGLCGDCSQPSAGKWRCSACHDHAYVQRKMRAIERGYCSVCTVKPAREDRSTCEDCGVKQCMSDARKRAAKKTSRRASVMEATTQQHEAPFVAASDASTSTLARRGTDSEAAE